MVRQIISKFVTFVACLALSTGVAVKASSVASQDIEDLAVAASSILRVEVLSQKFVEFNDFPHLAVEVRVLEALTGPMFDLETTTIYLPGGKSAGDYVHVHGVADLELGNEYIVFLDEVEAMQWTALIILRDQSGRRFVSLAQERNTPMNSLRSRNQLALSQGLAGPVVSYNEALDRIFSVLD